MFNGNALRIWTTVIFLVTAAAGRAAADDRLLIGEKRTLEVTPGDNRVHHPCLTPSRTDRILLPLERDKPWSLPKAALAQDFADTVNILVMRFNFQFEDPDDPNTTGRGRMDDTTDVNTFLDTAGHFIDPPPHDSFYFDAHMQALRTYWETVSDDRLTITWDIFPPGNDSIYELAHPMSFYGRCNFEDVEEGLAAYFVDAIRLADTTSPEIEFADYESIFLFHAGSDRQNDIGFPETCSDMFTGYITFGDSVAVDHDSGYVRTALLMPETSNQDNRAVALNAVLAHEFGHQLGLVDLYSTATFMTILGDFALMDNNGFGAGIDFGFEVGSTFGAIPLYPIAWSRAFLGFIEVVDYRAGSDIRLVAAEVISEGIKAARVPITESEYYLIENRLIDIDGQPAAARLDEVTSVILGPTDTNRVFNREYDFLLPGSGVLIYHVDERVAGLDYNYDGESNFDDNHLQWVRDIYGNEVDRFITLVEADGIVNFGGYYRSGFGSEDDMYRDDRNNSLTPNTNPPAIDNSGNNTHIYITDITRASSGEALMDSVILFDLEVDRLADGFPVRGGYPSIGLSPVADDIDGDGSPEIIFASGDRVEVTTLQGGNFLREYTDCTTCPIYEDTAYASVNAGQSYPVPVYAITSGPITSRPVTGRFADDPETTKMIAVGYWVKGDPYLPIPAAGWVDLYSLRDEDNNGRADLIYENGISYFRTPSAPVAVSFGDVLYCVTEGGQVYRKEALFETPDTLAEIDVPDILGICRADGDLIVMAGDGITTQLYCYVGDERYVFDLGDNFVYGPVLADVNLDDVAELVAATADGRVILVAVDPASGGNPFSAVDQRQFEYAFVSDPIISDVDLDGLPDIVIGGINAVYAFNHELTLKTSFPKEINDRYPGDAPSAAPVAADVDGRDFAELIFPTQIGNVYAFGPELSYGFPLSGGEATSGSPVIVSGADAGGLGYLGADGWFYLWDVVADNNTNFWPMRGADPAGTFAFNSARLPALKQYSELLPGGSFYNYPNPVVDGVTTIRYFLGREAVSVALTIYDMSGREIASLDGPVSGRVDNEISWNCGDVTPGVYRCMIDVDFGNQSETAFTDIAIIR